MTSDADSMTLMPQLIFDGEERLIYCDSDDMIALGAAEVENRFYTRLRHAYGHFKIFGPNARKRDHKGHDMLKFSRVGRVRSGYRFPPRICCSKGLSGFGSDGIMFNLRYLTEADRNRVLDVLSKLDWSKRAKESMLHRGSELPEVHIRFVLTDAIRSLTKIGFNLLAFFCRSTQVHRSTFRRTVEWIIEGKHLSECGDVQRFGFINPRDIAKLACPPKSHRFRLTHDLSINTWKMYASFFGGKAAAYVAFPGPNDESWATMEVIAPYKRPMHRPHFDKWYRPFDTQPVVDPREMLPTISWQTAENRVQRFPPDVKK